MISEFKKKIKKYNLLASNFSYLSVLEVFQLLIPLLIYPYLIRVLGKEIYGIVIFANALTAYFVVFIKFGFEISEIREISIWRQDKKKISEKVSAVISIKSIFAVLCITIYLPLIYYIPELNEHKLLYLATFPIIINSAINPQFYFMGLEKMKLITLLTSLSRMIFLSLIFLFIKSPDDYFYVPLITGVGSVSSSLVGLYIVFVKDQLKFSVPNIFQIKEVLKNSFPFFFSRLSTLIINKTNVMLLGAFVGYSQVAYYDLAEKIVSFLKVPFKIFNKVLFPNVSKTKNIKLVRKTLLLLLTVYIIGYFSLFVVGEYAIVILGGNDMLNTQNVLLLLGITVVTELISVFLGAPMLLAMGYKSKYTNSIIFGSLFYISIVILLYISNTMGLYTLTISTVMASLFIMLYRITYCKKYQLL